MSSYFDGLLYGLVFILALGPAFFALAQTALQKGFTHAMSVSVGAVMTDLLIIGLTLLGLGPIFDNPEVKFWFGVGGAIMLVAFGITSWLKARSIDAEEGKVEGGSMFSFWLKGVVLNGLNPVMIIFWIGMVGSVSALGYSVNEQTWFFGGFFTTVFCIDALKAYFIIRLSKYLTAKRLTIANRVIGSIFILFGIRIVVYLLGWV